MTPPSTIAPGASLGAMMIRSWVRLPRIAAAYIIAGFLGAAGIAGVHAILALLHPILQPTVSRSAPVIGPTIPIDTSKPGREEAGPELLAMQLPLQNTQPVTNRVPEIVPQPSPPAPRDNSHPTIDKDSQLMAMLEAEQAEVARQALDKASRTNLEMERRIAQDKIRAARLAIARLRANDALREADYFIKYNKNDPKLLDKLQAIVDLRAAMNNSDPTMLEREQSRLQASLEADPLYRGWTARQTAELVKDESAALRDALAILAVQRRFIVDQVGANPLGANAVKFINLIKEADTTRDTPTLAGVQTLVSRIDVAIQDANLGQTYALARASRQRGIGDGSTLVNTPHGIQTEGAVR